MEFPFVKGDEVFLKARPASGIGVVTEVLAIGAEPQYRVVFSGQAQIYSARHLELARRQEHRGTAAMPRVQIETACGDERWSTIGCSQNIIEASWQALWDSLELPLLRDREHVENLTR